ncbi:hypothetical protein CP49_12030 [Bradyrhizobium valentinum]|uniref:Uncharacterized protein n=2 Tax=Bradyrhizobium valentinum TaxID=1518501 RepID=A0A0R3L2J4_9BRAD|nr:hypothetical protein CP49_12030 [Bradyrhizobium valentinum]
MPPECCRWLVDDAADLARPDRSHVVIDIMPDFITIREGETDQPRHIQVDQYWIDPRHRDAHRDPSLRRFMFRRAQDGIAALIRFNERDALTVFAPPFDINGQWHEVGGYAREQTHSLPEIVKALSG